MGQFRGSTFGPARQGGFKSDRVERQKKFAERPPLGRPAGEAQGVNQVELLVVDPLGDRLETACAAENRATNRGQHCRKRMSPPVGGAGIGDGAKGVRKRAASWRDHRCVPSRGRKPFRRSLTKATHVGSMISPGEGQTVRSRELLKPSFEWIAIFSIVMTIEEYVTPRRAAKEHTFLVSPERFRGNVQSRVETARRPEERARTYKKPHRSGFFVDDGVTLGEDGKRMAWMRAGGLEDRASIVRGATRVGPFEPISRPFAKPDPSPSQHSPSVSSGWNSVESCRTPSCPVEWRKPILSINHDQRIVVRLLSFAIPGDGSGTTHAGTGRFSRPRGYTRFCPGRPKAKEPER